MAWGCYRSARTTRGPDAVLFHALAPVAGFGWLIATIGLAQCRWDQRALRAAYITVFLLILAYAEVPWTGVLLDWTLR